MEAPLVKVLILYYLHVQYMYPRRNLVAHKTGIFPPFLKLSISIAYIYYICNTCALILSLVALSYSQRCCSSLFLSFVQQQPFNVSTINEHSVKLPVTTRSIMAVIKWYYLKQTPFLPSVIVSQVAVVAVGCHGYQDDISMQNEKVVQPTYMVVMRWKKKIFWWINPICRPSY